MMVQKSNFYQLVSFNLVKIIHCYFQRQLAQQCQQAERSGTVNARSAVNRAQPLNRLSAAKL